MVLADWGTGRGEGTRAEVLFSHFIIPSIKLLVRAAIDVGLMRSELSPIGPPAASSTIIQSAIRVSTSREIEPAPARRDVTQ